MHCRPIGEIMDELRPNLFRRDILAGLGRADLDTPAPNKQPNFQSLPRVYPDPSLPNEDMVPIQLK